MKVTKEGKVRLEKGEVRLGNFFIRDEGEDKPIKVVDLNGCFSIRVSKRMPLGIWLTNIMEMGEKGHETLRTWIATMWAVLSMVPDQEFVEGLVKTADACLERHPDWYGGRKGEATEEEDAAALEEVKNLNEFEEDVRKIDVEDDVQPEA